jgi:riboflavin biosynthesis pyrimidine reductase
VRQLLPHPADDVDLAAAYAYPEKRPWVRANMVASVDGAGALHGRTKGLSSPADQRAFSVLRQLADVVLVGAGTVRAERYGAEPVRPEHVDRRRAAGQHPAPVMAVVSKSLDLDPASALFSGPTRTIVITCTEGPPDRRRALAAVADVIDTGEDEVDLGAAVDALHARGLDRVSCEGGPLLLGRLVAAGRLDELCFTLSPMLVGGAPPRLLADVRVPDRIGLQLVHLLADDGFLFAKYLVDRG